MATKCIDSKNDYELLKINTSDKELNKIANEYIQEHNINVQQSTGFTCLINKLSQYITVDKNNIDDLIYYFNIYIELCTICNNLLDMTGYCLFIDLSYDTYKDWVSGQNRSATHTPIIKKMRDFCKMNCVAEAGRGNVGAIYVSKAIHGLSDSAPAQQLTQNNLYINAPITRDAIAAEFGAMIEKSDI